MSFLYPLGLLGLIGVPILIIIYIIKNKYTEQTVSSTYLWTLSERFLKRKNPINKLAGIISLILQILAVVFLSFGIAHPVFTLPGMANRYTLILDCSGSMLMQSSQTTRFEKAKDALVDVVNGAVDGSSFTFISAGSSTIVYEPTESKSRVLSLIEQASVDSVECSSTQALGSAQEIFSENPSTYTYFATDVNYEEHQNVTILNVSSGEVNAAVSDVNYIVNDTLEVSGRAASYGRAAKLNVKLTVYRGEEVLSFEQQVDVEENGEKLFEFTATKSGEKGEENIIDFDSFVVEITDSDDNPADNSVTVYSVEGENSYRTLLVSDNPIFIQGYLQSTGKAEVQVYGIEDYQAAYPVGGVVQYPSGFGLYVYEGFTPSVLPRDGTIWFFGPEEVPAEAAFSVQGEVELEHGGALSYSTSTSTLVNTLLEGVPRGSSDGGSNYDVHVKKYVKCSPNRSYTALLTYNGAPVVFTAQTAYGNREVVFAFDLVDSDAILNPGFLVMLNNLISYSFPAAIENTLYVSGDSALVNVVSNTESIRVEDPDSKVTYLDTTNASTEFLLEKVGVYTITLTVGGTPRVCRIYSAFPKAESRTSVTQTGFSIVGERTNEGYDGRYEDLWVIFALLAAVVIADWMVYCYEQYQLR